MARDYLRDMYEPIASKTDALAADAYRRARELARWKQKVLATWMSVRVVSVDSDAGAATVDLGGEWPVSVEVDLGDLDTGDVAVELLHGPVAAGDELVETDVVRLTLAGKGPAGSGSWRYEGNFRCERSGRHGYTVRIVPSNPDMTSTLDLGCISWA